MIYPLIEFTAFLCFFWFLGFIGPFIELRRLHKELYGEPTSKTLWTIKHFPEKRETILYVRELGIERYDTICIRTLGQKDVVVSIPKP